MQRLVIATDLTDFGQLIKVNRLVIIDQHKNLCLHTQLRIAVRLAQACTQGRARHDLRRAVHIVKLNGIAHLQAPMFAVANLGIQRP